MLNQKYFTANSVLSTITGLIITMMLAVAGVMIFFLSILDQNTIEDSNDRVTIAFNVEKKDLIQLNVEYSYWDTGYEKTVNNPDQEWITDYYVDYVVPHYNIDLIALINTDNKVQLLAQSGDKFNSSNIRELLNAEVQNKINLTKQNPQPFVSDYAFFTTFNDASYLITVEPFRFEEAGDIVDGTYLVLAKELNNTYLSALSEKFKLPDLSLDKFTGYDDSYSLTAEPSQAVVGHLYWNVSKITTQIVPYLLLSLTLFLLFAIAFARWILRKDLQDITLYQEKLFNAATTDPLTNIANRRYYDDFGKREFQLHLLNKKPMTVLVLDLDYFKSINDQYGHDIGDEALKHFSQICENNVRQSDMCARVGGEEFSIILSDTTLTVGIEMANRIRQLLFETPFTTQHQTIDLSVSIGVATLEEHSSFDELIKDADEALYAAKNAGRNRVKSTLDTIHSDQSE